jgi:hypothetical protein
MITLDYMHIYIPLGISEHELTRSTPAFPVLPAGIPRVSIRPLHCFDINALMHQNPTNKCLRLFQYGWGWRIRVLPYDLLLALRPYPQSGDGIWVGRFAIADVSRGAELVAFPRTAAIMIATLAVRVACLGRGIACVDPEATLEQGRDHRSLSDKDADAVFAHRP